MLFHLNPFAPNKINNPKKILNTAKLSTLWQLDARKAEANIPNWESTSSILGPYLLYNNDIGREPSPKQKLLILKIKPSDALVRP